MKLKFKALGLREQISSKFRDVVQLDPSNWDDFSFKTSFAVWVYPRTGEATNLGSVKIGFFSQPYGWTRDKIGEDTLTELPADFFSLGQDVDYYKAIMSHFVDDETRHEFLRAMRDVAADSELHSRASNEKVFSDSLLRTVSSSAISGQFRRVLKGQAALTDFKFKFSQTLSEKSDPLILDFHVEAESHPPTNIHVLIGRNGVGKTTLLNNMVRSLVADAAEDPPSSKNYGFSKVSVFDDSFPADYFSSLVSVSFSAFDPFVPPMDRQDKTDGPAYFYVGMKNNTAEISTTEGVYETNMSTAPPKSHADLVEDFVSSFKVCISQVEKKARLYLAISRLESDSNFKEMELGRLSSYDDDNAVNSARRLAMRMSSGHSIVLLTITKLVEKVEEKTLVLLDEPESHLHPPLLAAFTRALSELLFNRNGVAIVATHSPVVLQEVPKSCAWILTRSLRQSRADRPRRETFGENVGILTNEVFGLEVKSSGFHALLEQAVRKGGDFSSIKRSFAGQLGDEAQAILISMLHESVAEIKK